MTERRSDSELLNFATLDRLDSGLRTAGRNGLLGYITKELPELRWHPWVGWQATDSDFGLGSGTASTMASIACLLRVVPDLPAGPEDVAWDNNQQETPGCPTTVRGLAGKLGNTILKAAFVQVFAPLLSTAAVDAVSAGTDRVLTTADVQQLFSMVHRATHANYTAGPKGV